MSLSIRPIGRTVPFSASGAGTAGVTFVETDKPPPGWYLVQISASSDDTTHPANLALKVGSTPFGLTMPTGAATVAFELLLQLEGARSVSLTSVATSAGGKSMIATILITPVEAPPAAEWSYSSRGQAA